MRKAVAGAVESRARAPWSLHRQTQLRTAARAGVRRSSTRGARTFVRLARRIFERFCASAISRAASSSSRSSVFIGASFGARFIVDSSGAFGAGFTAAFGVRTGSGSFFASSDFVVFDAHDGGARGVERGVGGAFEEYMGIMSLFMYQKRKDRGTCRMHIFKWVNWALARYPKLFKWAAGADHRAASRTRRVGRRRDDNVVSLAHKDKLPGGDDRVIVNVHAGAQKGSPPRVARRRHGGARRTALQALFNIDESCTFAMPARRRRRSAAAGTREARVDFGAGRGADVDQRDGGGGGGRRRTSRGLEVGGGGGGGGDRGEGVPSRGGGGEGARPRRAARGAPSSC